MRSSPASCPASWSAPPYGPPCGLPGGGGAGAAGEVGVSVTGGGAYAGPGGAERTFASLLMARPRHDGYVVKELLKDLESRYPGLTKNLQGEDGTLHRHVNIYVNDEDVRYLGSLDTEIKDGDVVSVLPAVAGG